MVEQVKSHASIPLQDLQLMEKRLRAYADWVHSLQSGEAVEPPFHEGDDPLAMLGRELEQLAATIANREDQLRRLLALVQTVEGGIFLEEVLTRVFEGFRGSIPYERIGCAFVADSGQNVVAFWGKSELGPIRIKAGFSQKLAGSSLQRIIDTKEPRIINDLEAYLVEHPKSASTRLIVAEGGRASLTCPLTHNGRAIGFLFFTSRERNAYTKSHQSMFLQIAAQVSIVIEKSRLYERAIKQNELLKVQAKELSEIASQDALTGVMNRRAIDAALRKRHEEAMENGRRFGVIIADIDHFKKINDTHGHDGGDKALVEFTRRLAKAIRKTDVLGRFGGEEFLIIAECSRPEELHDAAERLRRAIESEHFLLSEAPHKITASFGAAHLGEEPEPVDSLVKRADTALYKAKNEGRNCCKVG